jgi:hypothetical protein
MRHYRPVVTCNDQPGKALQNLDASVRIRPPPPNFLKSLAQSRRKPPTREHMWGPVTVFAREHSPTRFSPVVPKAPAGTCSRNATHAIRIPPAPRKTEKPGQLTADRARRDSHYSPHIPDDAIFRLLDRMTLTIFDLSQRPSLPIDVPNGHARTCSTGRLTAAFRELAVP